MIGVIRTGKNPTMRHLERTHGNSIGWMHSIFQEGYVSLAYEVTAKMAADIHTKSFKDSVSWTHACQLINIFPPALIGSQEIMDLMRPTHSQSADEKGIQHYSRSKARSLASLILRRPYCLRCCIVPVYPARRVCKNMTAWTPCWLSSSRACCGGRLLRCRRVVTFGRPGFSVKGSGTKWRIKRKFPTVQPSLIATWSVLPCRRPHAPCRIRRRLANALCAPCLPNGGRWLPRWRAPSMRGTRASHYLFVSTVDPIELALLMWVTHDGPPLSKMCGNIWRRKGVKCKAMEKRSCRMWSNSKKITMVA